MKIGIIGAMEEEIRLLKQNLSNGVEEDHFGIRFYLGELANKQVVLVQSGIGKVNATITVTLLKQIYGITHLINTGSAGALDGALEVGDIVISTSLNYHDVDVTAFGYKAGQMAGMPEQYLADVHLMRLAQESSRQLGIEPYLGMIVSGDQFVSHAAIKERIMTDFPLARAVEMESTAIAQAAYVLSIPFVIIRAISDTASDEAAVSFDDFIVMAGKVAARMVEATVQAM